MTDLGEVATPHRSRKDRRRWCGGKVGREHEPEIRLRDRVWFTEEQRARPQCGPERLFGWMCDHQRSCSRCGKVLDYMLDESECPTRQP